MARPKKEKVEGSKRNEEDIFVEKDGFDELDSHFSSETKKEDLIIYPHDNGLLYIVVYMTYFDTQIHSSNFNDSNKLISLYKTRRDAPQFVRSRTKKYLDSLGWNESAPMQQNHVMESHLINLSRLKAFEADYREDYINALEKITDHYEEQLKGNAIEELRPNLNIHIKDDKNTIIWFDEESMNTFLSRRGNSGDKNDTYPHYIRKLLQIGPSKQRLVVHNEDIFDFLAEKFPNFIEVIDFFKAQFRLCEVTGKSRIPPILLLGAPGIGKTEFVKHLAKVLSTGFTYVDMASTSAPWVLSGHSSLWSGSKPGKVLDAMANSPTASPIIMLDEIEKPVRPDLDPKNSLFQLLEETSAKSYVDEFVEHPVDLSHVIFIACANELHGLSEPLQSRFKIFDIPSPTAEQQSAILQKIYQAEILESQLFNKTLNTDIIDSLLKDSLRVAKQKICDGIGRALLELTQEQIQSMKSSNTRITIQPHHFKISHSPTKRKIGF